MPTGRQFLSTRRRFLGATAAGATALAGCSSSASDDECTEADRSSVAAERAIPSAAVREVAAPIRFEDLSDAENYLIRARTYYALSADHSDVAISY